MHPTIGGANGGIATATEAIAHLDQVDGVMLGRAAYHDSYVLAELDGLLFRHEATPRHEIVERMWRYAQGELETGTPLRAITRHMLGLYHGQPRARKWRHLLSDSGRLASNDADLILQAHELVEPSAIGAHA